MLERVAGGHRDRQRLRIGEPHVLRREDDHPPHDEPGILAGVDHPPEPEQRRVRVGSAHALDERGDDVEVAVATVVGDDPLLDRIRDPRPVDQRLAGVGQQDGRLESGERRPGIAGGELNEVVERVVGERHAECTHPPLGVDHRELEEPADLLRLQGLEAEQEAP